MNEKPNTAKPSFLAGNSRTSLPLYYWSVICGLTMGLSLFPTLEFLNEVRSARGHTAGTVLFLISLFAAAIVMSQLKLGYFKIRLFESSGRVYELLGVRVFRIFVPMGDGINRLVRRFQPDYRIINKESIEEFENRTITAETFHLACWLAIVPSAIYSIILGWWKFAILLTLSNVVLHLYPVILQRYTRARLQRFRQARRTSATPIDRSIDKAKESVPLASMDETHHDTG